MDSKPFHILHVEDDDVHAGLVRRILADAPVRVELIRLADGADAIRYLRGTGAGPDRPWPDLILLDLKLPKISGHEVLRALKRDDRLRQIPVVVLTCSDSEDDRRRAYAAYANSYLVKPLKFTELERLLRDLNDYWATLNRPAPPSGRGRAGTAWLAMS